MIVRGEVPPPGVDDEAVGAQLPVASLTGERRVRGQQAVPAPDRVGHEQEHLRLDRHPHRLGARERNGGLERLDPSPERRRQDAMDLLERALGMVATGIEPEPSRRGEADHDHHDLVVAQHQRRQPVARLQAVPAADATLALDRDAELLEVVDVAPDGAAVDAEVVRDLASARDRSGLEQLEDLEQP